MFARFGRIVIAPSAAHSWSRTWRWVFLFVFLFVFLSQYLLFFVCLSLRPNIPISLSFKPDESLFIIIIYTGWILILCNIYNIFKILFSNLNTGWILAPHESEPIQKNLPTTPFCIVASSNFLWEEVLQKQENTKKMFGYALIKILNHYVY